MIKTFGEAFLLLWRHLGLFSSIILTVWLPGNTLISILEFKYGASDSTIMRLSMMVEGVLGPIYIGALVYALAQIKNGKAATYQESLAVGFRKWGSLFFTRFVASLFVGIGLLAFVIPGIVLAIRYAFLAPVVILEGMESSAARARSTALTAGRRWRIFVSAILYFIALIVFSILTLLPLEFVESDQLSMPICVALYCVHDIAYSVIQIVMFLYYWESLEREIGNKQFSEGKVAIVDESTI